MSVVTLDDQNLARRREDWETAEAVHESLRAAILRNEFPAGAILNQVHLAKQLGVSRTPLREAFRMLRREGLIEGKPNQRVRVATMSLTGLEDLYAMRICLEALAVRLTVPRLSEADLDGLDARSAEMEAFAQAEDYRQWETPHRAFHLGLVAHAGIQQRRLVEELFDHATRYRRAYTTEIPRAWSRGVREHRGILQACRDRDAALASERLARHYSSVVVGLLGALAPEHEPVAVRAALRMAAANGAPAGPAPAP